MPYDDDPYWGGFVNSKPDEKNQPVAPRSPKDASVVMAEAEKTYRAPNPSPLLQEWLAKKGLAVK